MLKDMKVTVEYKIYIQKDVIADNDEDGGETGYDTVNQKTANEVNKIIQPIIKTIKNKLPNEYKFSQEYEYTIEE